MDRKKDVRVSTTLTMDKSVIDKIKDIAAQENRSVSNLVETVLIRWIESRS